MGICSSNDRPKSIKTDGIALIWGINYVDNPNGWSVLQGTHNDADTMAKLVKDIYGFNEINIYKKHADTTKKALLKHLEDLEKTCHNKNVFIGFSGHGKQTVFNPEKSDFKELDNKDEALCAYDDWILDHDFTPIILRIAKNSKRTFLFLDCCYASGTIDAQKTSLPNNFSFIGSSLEHEKSEADHIRQVETPSGTAYEYESLGTKWLDKALRSIGATATPQEIYDSMSAQRWTIKQQHPFLMTIVPQDKIFE